MASVSQYTGFPRSATGENASYWRTDATTVARL